MSRPSFFYLDQHHTLSEAQHSFRLGKNKSTRLSYIPEWLKALDTDCDVEVCYLDFRRAFDSVPHDLLETKLRSIGINGKALIWIKAFLQDNQQQDFVDGNLSSKVKVLSGGSQDSVIGPLLFIIFIDDLPQALITSKCIMYADDAMISAVGCRLSGKFREDFQQDLDVVAQWSARWRLPLNILKCKNCQFRSC